MRVTELLRRTIQSYAKFDGVDIKVRVLELLDSLDTDLDNTPFESGDDTEESAERLELAVEDYLEELSEPPSSKKEEVVEDEDDEDEDKDIEYEDDEKDED